MPLLVSGGIIIRGMRLILSLVAASLLVPQSYPPPYPRQGTRSLVDNERVQVWDVAGRKSLARRRRRCTAISTT